MNGIFYNITRETSKEDLSKAKAVEELIITDKNLIKVTSKNS